MKLLGFIFGLALAQNGTETTTAASEQTTGVVPIETTTAAAETTRPVPETTKPTTTPAEVTTTAAPIDPIPTGEDGIVRVRKDNETCAMVQFEGSYTLDDITGTISSNNSALMPASTCEKPIIQSEGALLTLEFNYTTTANGAQNVTTWDIASVSLTFDGVEYDGAVEGMQAHAGSSYSCQTGFNTTLTAPNLNNATYSLTLERVRVQYAIEDVASIKEDKFAKAESCAADMEQSLLVPIVVACALAGLVLAICVAYIIGRRRTYSGYAAM